MPDKNFIMTADGTRTLYCDAYGEAMHSTSGAYEESLLKHVFPSKVAECGNNPVNVLDIGFGLGYTILALIDVVRRSKKKILLNIVSVEKDHTNQEYLQSVHFNDYRDESYAIIRSAYADGFVRSGNIRIEILFEDARHSVKKLGSTRFDAVFHDPFSPSKNPELWSVDFFRKISQLISPDGILTTYSSAVQIRSAMIHAGFIIGKGPSVGKKREGTIAALRDIIEPLPQNEIDNILSNRRAIPYRDPKMNDTRESILKRRRDEMKNEKSDHVIEFIKN